MSKSYRDGTFGPVVREVDGELTAACTYCVFRVFMTCTHQKPSRVIPDPGNTPEWCEMRDSMLADVRAGRA